MKFNFDVNGKFGGKGDFNGKITIEMETDEFIRACEAKEALMPAILEHLDNWFNRKLDQDERFHKDRVRRWEREEDCDKLQNEIYKKDGKISALKHKVWCLRNDIKVDDDDEDDEEDDEPVETDERD